MINTAQIQQNTQDEKPYIRTVSTQEAFDELKNLVSKHWHTRKELPVNQDTLSIYNYTKTFAKKNPSTVAQQRQPEFVSTLHTEVEKLLGSEVAQSVTKQLETNHSFSTAQHFSSISHPKTLNASLQTALPYFDKDSKDYQNVLVLSCANISFDNPWFPRGILFHSLVNEQLIENRFPFYSRKVRPYPIRNHPAYSKEGIQAVMTQLQAMKRENTITEAVYSKMLEIIATVYADDKVLSCQTFTEQTTIANFRIWQEFFKATAQDLNVPNLVFIEQENIVLQLLAKYHMKQDTLIHQLLFKPEGHALLEKYFDTIQGGFSLKQGKGTFLFWALPKDQKYRIQLFRKGNKLVSQDESYSVELTPESVAQKIAEKELIPSTLLSLTLLSLYYGYVLTGGRDQPHYLTQMKKAYTHITNAFGDTESITAYSDIATKNYTITRPTLAYITGPNDTRNPATGLDAILYAQKGTWNAVLEASKKVTIDNLLNRILPNIYEDCVPDEEKTALASSVTEREIEKLTGLDKKIPPLVRMY